MKAKENLVISGISGQFPECENIDIFSERLINGECLITFDEQRWPNGTYGLPDGTAKLRDVDKFDAEFFGYSDEEANVLDPMNRILLENTYNCICDSGTIPESLRGSNTGFFFGSWVDEVESGLRNDIERTENIFSLFSSRIPYYFDFRGPVCFLDNACASSLTCLDIAVKSIINGRCDQAVVVACNLTMNPSRCYWQHLMKTLAPDSVCKLWDKDADGYVKGEAAVCVFVQKKSEAKRIYAEILGIGVNVDGFKRKGFTFPGWRTQEKVILEAMTRACIKGQDFDFFEAHGTGTPAGDPTEVKAIAKCVCNTRTKPLIIGSIKATIGHTEGAAGLASLVKVIIAYQRGIMAPSLNHEIPNPKIPQLFDGSVVVCNKPMKFNGGIVGINNFGIGGGNATLIVKSFDDKLLDGESYCICEPIPRIVLICGRNDQLVGQKLLKLENKSQNLTKEFLSLLNDISDISPESGMNSRGFLILNEQKKCFDKIADKCLVEGNQRRPLWFVFTGLGSQWSSMVQSLIKIDLFSKSMHRSLTYLKSIGADVQVLHKYLMESDFKKNCSEFEPLFTALAVLQIGFVDLLNALGVKPDGIIGHSVGEIAAAYADQCITAEEALRIAQFIHRSVISKEKISSIVGRMAAVGLSWSEAQNRCFGSIAVACNNSPNMVTMSGNVDDMGKLINKLNKEKVFVREVENHGLAAHSPLMNQIDRSVDESIKLNINPKQRTNRWLSTTYPQNEWHNQLCQWPLGEYFVQNLIKPVLFYDCLIKAPKNCLFLEIGPYGLLNNSIARSFEAKHNILYKELLKKDNNSENLMILLTALGQIYITGRSVNIGKLYPIVNYPIPRGTELISPLITWNHTKSRFVTKFPNYYSQTSKTALKFNVSLNDQNQYLSDHSIDGRVLYPAMGYLFLAWKTLAHSLCESDFRKLPVNIWNVNFYEATHLSTDETVFKCIYFKETSKFEILVNKTICANGYISVLKDKNEILFGKENQNNRNERKILSGNDFYKEIRVRGYDYGNNFQNITHISSDGSEATIKWMGNMIGFMDALLQMYLWAETKRFLCVPTRIETFKIDLMLIFGDQLERGQNKFTVDIFKNSYTNEIKTNGMLVCNITLTPIARKMAQNGEIILENYRLIPYEDNRAIDKSLAQMIDNYSKQCNKTIEKVRKQIQELQEFVNGVEVSCDAIKDNDHSLKDEGLMKYITNFYAKTNSQINKNSDNYSSELDNDLIHSTLLSERFLRTHLDVIIENTNFNRKISILEINSSKQLFYRNTMRTVARTEPGLAINNIEYTLCHPNRELLPKNILDSKRLKFKVFDINKSILPYRELSPQNVVIFRDPNISLNQSIIQLDYKLLLRSIQTTLTDGGFLLAFIRDNVLPCEQILCPTIDSSALKISSENFIKYAEEADLQYVCRKSDTFTCSSILFRKVDKNAKRDVEIHINNYSLEWLEPLKCAMNEERVDRIWLISGNELNGIIGLIKCLIKEENGFKVRSLFYDFNQIGFERALNKAKQTDLLQNVFRHRVWGSFRHIVLPELPETRETNSGQIRQLKFGDLSAFKWCESPNFLWPLNRTAPKQTLIDVYYSPLNFKDVMHATARLSVADLSSHMSWDDVVLGLEFVGRRRDNGLRVMGMNSSLGLSTSIIATEDFLWPIPDDWSMEEAATVPCVYATAYYALIIRGRLKCGESVLIHAGTGGVGQAAINICLSMSCKLFTTVGTNEKINWIQKRFPQLSDSCISSSRNVTFEERVMKETNGRGVDVVLNSLTDDMFWASIRCLAENGRFCEIGKYQFVNNEAMDLSLLLKNKTFHGIYLDALFPNLNNLVTKTIDRQRQEMWQLLTDGIEKGVVQPLPQSVFSADETESAFRFMSSGKHIGKLVIKMRAEEPNLLSIAKPMTICAIPQTYFNPINSYIITGGLGGMGLELMYWMYERNARNFLLTSRSGIKTATQEFAINRLKEKKCKIIVTTDNASDISGAENILLKAQELGTIGGIFLLTLVLEDDLIINQSKEKFERVMNSKSTQGLIFDKLLRQLSQPIDYFVAFSSCSCGRGIAGQTNYAFANSIVERICDKRRADGLHGLAIQWGPVGDVGFVADHKMDRNFTTSGYSAQRIVSCLAQLDRFLQSNHSICCSFVRTEDTEEEHDSSASLLVSVCNILGMKDMNGLNASKKLADIGLDSLMSVEVKNLLDRELQLTFTTKEVQNITVGQLKSGFN